MGNFHNWLNLREWADFGLENFNKRPKPTPYDDPAPGHDIEYVVKMLMRENLGYKSPIPDYYFGEIQWGTAPGAIKLIVGPFGGLRAVVRKLEYNLNGEHVWVCKKVVEVKDKYLKSPDKLIADLSKVLNEVDHEEFDSPKDNYEGLERLTLKMASYLRKNTIQDLLVYEGIKKLQENKYYIIHFGCSGMGRQRQDQKRLDQFAIHVKYDDNTGLIEVSGNELGDVVGKHRWKYDPAQFFEYFMPSQKDEEIMEIILRHLNSY